MAQYTTMTHLLQRHYSVLPAGKSYADILTDGMSAALALGLEEVRRERPRQRDMPAPVMDAVPPVDAPPVTVYAPPVVGEMWGLGMSLPRGDM